jgi:signal transduction histidine kinase/DNA-binding response OmpR family regulator
LAALEFRSFIPITHISPLQKLCSYRLLVLFLGCLAGSSLPKLIGQELGDAYRFELITQDIRSNFGEVTQIYQDTVGVIWMGIPGKGLAYYDGRNISHYQLEEERTFSLYRPVFHAFNDRLLLNGRDRVYFFDPIQQEIQDSLVLSNDLQQYGQLLQLIPDDASSESVIWGVLSRQDAPTEFQLIKSVQGGPFIKVNIRLEVPSGPLVVIPYRGGLLYKGTRGFSELGPNGAQKDFHPFPSTIDLESITPKNCKLDEQGRLWFGSFRLTFGSLSGKEYGIYLYDLTARDLKLIKKTVPIISIISFWEDKLLVMNREEMSFYKWDEETLLFHGVLALNVKYDLSQISLGSQLTFMLKDRYSDFFWVGGTNGLGKVTPTLAKMENFKGAGLRSIVKDSAENVVVSGIQENRSENDRQLTTFQRIRRNKNIVGPGMFIKEKGKKEAYFIPYPASLDPYSLSYRDGYFYAGQIRFRFGVPGYELIAPEVSRIFGLETSKDYTTPILHMWDESGLLWMTQWYGSKVLVVDTDQKRIVKELEIPALRDEPVEMNMFYQRPSDGTVWLGTEGKGIYVFHPDGYLLEHLSSAPESRIQLPGNLFSAFYEDHKGNLWLGGNEGLACVEAGTDSIQLYKLVPDDPYFNMVYAILPQDNDQYFWLSTNRGLYRFEPQSGAVMSLPLHSGLQNVEFNRTSFLKDKEGKMYFGGTGVFIFHPDEINEYYASLPPQYTKVLVNALKVYNGDLEREVVQEKGLQTIQEIRLEPGDRYFELAFSSADLRAPESTLYTFKLEGYDKDWQPVSKESYRVRYENLPKGTYTLRMRGGLLPEHLPQSEKTIQVVVVPPWYQTTWAFLLFLGVLAGLGYGFYQFTLNRRLQREESKRLREVNQLKTRLYTNITHEFRTPLTVILGMAAQVKENTKARNLILRNGQNLLQLVNQILDLAKAESGQLQINWIQADAVAYIKYLSESFLSLAESKQVQLTSYAEIDTLQMDFDPEKVQHIVSNLLSNAIKFTPAHGKVVLHINAKQEAGQEWLVVKVADTGRGIPEEKQDQIFDRFFQVDDSSTRSGEGTGIGLALTKELVELLGGHINLQSQIGQGSTFSVVLPVRREAPISEVVPPKQGLTIDTTPEDAGAISENTDQVDLPLLLVIEDNQDVRTYIESILRDRYQVVMAENGRIGLEKAQELIPDIIISDVMMPEMDGMEVAQRLRDDERTSHIPIIMLTAKATQTDKNEGLRKGVDAFLTKPFDHQELQIRLQKLIELRKQLQQRYAGLQAPPPEATAEAEAPLQKEDAFITKLREVVENHLHEAEFGVNDLAKAVFLSHTQTYRKLKALTGLTPSQFIRGVRLQKARQLILETDLNISEIAYDVGFNDPNYFTRMFRETYGEQPSNLRE